MAIISSWAWFAGAQQWPGFSSSNPNSIGNAANNLAVDPDGYTDIAWHDLNNDGIITDSDRDDRSWPGEQVEIGGVLRTVKEVGNYTDSTMVVNGEPQTVNLAVWVFEDGTYMVRLADSEIPPGVHYSAVDSLQLGRWDRIEYTGSQIDTRDDPFVCFTVGTLILTQNGAVPVETLSPGDMVLTADHGFQPLRWIGQARVSGQGSAAPVRIAAGAMGNTRDLLVSQQHRMLVTGWRAELMVGASEVLVAAKHLINDQTIRITPMEEVVYVHILFDSHEIVFAEGIPSESFHPGAVGLSRLDLAARDEVLRLFPELDMDGRGYGPAARPSMTAAEGRAIAAAGR